MQDTSATGGVGQTEQASAAMSGTLVAPERITLTRTATAPPTAFLVQPASIKTARGVPTAKLAPPGSTPGTPISVYPVHPADTPEQDTQLAMIVQPAGTRARVDGQAAVIARAGSTQARRDPLAANIAAAGSTAPREHQAAALVRLANTPPVPLRRGARTAHQAHTSRARAKLRA